MTTKGRGTIRTDENSNYLLSIPARVFHDSKFPFKPGDSVDVEIEENRIIATKVDQDVDENQ